MPWRGQRAQFQPEAARTSSMQLTGSQRGAENPVGQGDGDALRGIDFASWGFSGPRTLSLALEPLSTMEPHCVAGCVHALDTNSLVKRRGQWTSRALIFLRVLPSSPVFPRAGLDSRSQLGLPPFLLLLPLNRPAAGLQTTSTIRYPSTQQPLESHPILPVSHCNNPGPSMPGCLCPCVRPPHLPSTETTTAFFYTNRNVYIYRNYIHMNPL